MNDELSRLEEMSEWYLTEQLDFDRRLIHLRYQVLRPHLLAPEGLELGPAEGQMTQLLSRHFARLTVVDAARSLLDRIPSRDNIVKVQALFEQFRPDHLFSTIVMEHVLEHVEDPVNLLSLSRKWLTPGGRLLLGVPNGHSIHRLAAVKMGLLQGPCELNERDIALGHRRVYTPGLLKRDIAAAKLRLVEIGGVFLKPLSNKQIQDHWSEEMIRGFFELGKDFPDNAAEIYAVCEYK